MKRWLSNQTQLLIQQLILASTITCGHGLWVGIKRMTENHIQAAEMRLHGVDRVTLNDWVRSAAIWEDLRIVLCFFTLTGTSLSKGSSKSRLKGTIDQ